MYEQEDVGQWRKVRLEVERVCVCVREMQVIGHQT